MYISLVFQTKHFLPSSSVFPHNCCLTRILSISRTFCGCMLKGQKKVFCDVVSICPLNMVNKTMASLLKQPQQPRFIQKKLSSEMCAIAAVKASAKKMPYYRTRDRLFGLWDNILWFIWKKQPVGKMPSRWILFTVILPMKALFLTITMTEELRTILLIILGWKKGREGHLPKVSNTHCFIIDHLVIENLFQKLLPLLYRNR